jgi:hypothetical protein
MRVALARYLARWKISQRCAPLCARGDPAHAEGVRTTAWYVAGALLLATLPAAAEEVQLTGPLKNAYSLALFREATPARWEWAYWNSLGALRSSTPAWGASGGIGAELTFGALTYPGFPSGPYGPKLGRAELRTGLWGQAVTRAAGGLVEAGLKLHLGALYHASWGTFDLRAGGGYGAFERERRPHVNITFNYGVRSTLSRYSQRGAHEPRPIPRQLALTSVARLFATYRREVSQQAASELVIGLELSPTFLLPPYSAWRFAGGWPQ